MRRDRPKSAGRSTTASKNGHGRAAEGPSAPAAIRATNVRTDKCRRAGQCLRANKQVPYPRQLASGQPCDIPTQPGQELAGDIGASAR